MAVRILVPVIVQIISAFNIVSVFLGVVCRHNVMHEGGQLKALGYCNYAETGLRSL